MTRSGQEALIDIRTFAVISGSLPVRALGLVAAWASLHREELLALWEKAKNLDPLHTIAPAPVEGRGNPAPSERERAGVVV